MFSKAEKLEGGIIIIKILEYLIKDQLFFRWFVFFLTDLNWKWL